MPKNTDNEAGRSDLLISIASLLGQVGLFEEMAETINLIETTDKTDLQNHWKTIKATLDLHQ